MRMLCFVCFPCCQLTQGRLSLTELLFLMARYLSSGPCKNAAAVSFILLIRKGIINELTNALCCSTGLARGPCVSCCKFSPLFFAWFTLPGSSAQVAPGSRSFISYLCRFACRFYLHGTIGEALSEIRRMKKWYGPVLRSHSEKANCCSLFWGCRNIFAFFFVFPANFKNSGKPHDGKSTRCLRVLYMLECAVALHVCSCRWFIYKLLTTPPSARRSRPRDINVVRKFLLCSQLQSLDNWALISQLPHLTYCWSLQKGIVQFSFKKNRLFWAKQNKGKKLRARARGIY